MIEESMFATLRLDLAQQGWNENEIEEHVSRFDMGYVLGRMWQAYHMLVDDIGEKPDEDDEEGYEECEGCGISAGLNDNGLCSECDAKDMPQCHQCEHRHPGLELSDDGLCSNCQELNDKSDREDMGDEISVLLPKSILKDIEKLFELEGRRDEIYDGSPDYDEAFEVECEMRDLSNGIASAINDAIKH